MTVSFTKIEDYFASATSRCDRIAKIDLIIDQLITTALNAAGKDGVIEASLNDGQTIIKTEYRGSAEIAKAIKDYEMIRIMYANQGNRVVRLIDSKSF